MPEQEFKLEITDKSVLVRLNVPGRARFYALAFFAGVATLLLCVLLFLPGKHGRPSMWHVLSTSSVGSTDFLIPFFLLLLGAPLLMVVLPRRYVMLAYPSDPTFRCDRSTLSVSKVRWLDVNNNHWDTCSFPLAEVRGVRYQVIAQFRTGAVYGLRFAVSGETLRVLPGLKPKDAERVLTALKIFGADVPDDPELQRKLKEDSSHD
jgi:hypothetical protein